MRGKQQAETGELVQVDQGASKYPLALQQFACEDCTGCLCPQARTPSPGMWWLLNATM